MTTKVKTITSTQYRRLRELVANAQMHQAVLNDLTCAAVDITGLGDNDKATDYINDIIWQVCDLDTALREMRIKVTR